jgi:glycerol-3-phosphate dehydrogenase
MKFGLPHLRLDAAQTLRLFPTIRREGLSGAITFDEWWVDPVKLVKANIASAKDHGAEASLQTYVSEFIIQKTNTRRVAGIRIEEAGVLEEMHAPVVINASGPWADRVASLAGLRVPLRLQKGTHLVYQNPIPCLPKDFPIGLLLETDDHERYIFVVSSGQGTLLGPTDLPGGDDPDLISTGKDEIRYLLSSVRPYFADFPDSYDLTTVGARPILAQPGEEKNLSREYDVIDHEMRDGTAGFITVVGGKMSDFRLMAQDAVDLACRKLGKSAPCQTSAWTLDGQAVGDKIKASPPAKAEAHFLRKHPFLRQSHALSFLGLSYARHLVRKILKPRLASYEEFIAHYSSQ